jgi:hypothetical protein
MGHLGPAGFAQLRQTTWTQLVGDMQGSESALHLAGQSLEESTIATYSWAFRKFLKYCKSQKRVWTEVATTVGGIASFQGYLYEAGMQASTIPSVVSAVNKIVVDFGLDKPQHSLLLSISQALKKRASEQEGTRATMKSSVIVRIMNETRTLLSQRQTRSRSEATYQRNARMQVQSALAVVLGFVFMLRRSSIHSTQKRNDKILFMQRQHLQLEDPSRVDLCIQFEKGKHAPRTVSVRGYVSEWIHSCKAYLPENDDAYLFQDAQQELAHGHDVQAMLVYWLDRLQVQPPLGMKFQWHSLRKGGATAAHVCGAQTITLQHFGGWKTPDSLTKSYIDFSHLLQEEDSLLMQFLCLGQLG